MTIQLSPAETFGRVPGVSLDPERMHLVARSCACGVAITAEATNPAPAVAMHNRTWPHRVWWQRTRVAWQGEES